jgi:hypothetical protein
MIIVSYKLILVALKKFEKNRKPVQENVAEEEND